MMYAEKYLHDKVLKNKINK